VLLGTVQGDIHDIGKDMVGMLLTCHGFTVIDLAVDVPPPNLWNRFPHSGRTWLGFQAC